MQDGSYLKLRELTLSYNLPDRITRNLFGAASATRGSRSAGATCSASPATAGLDPEVSNFGNQAIVRNIDVAPFPPSRSFFFSSTWASDHDDRP